MNDNMKAVDTYKSGPFYFSLRFDEGKISQELFKAHSLFHIVSNIPILPEIAAQLDEDLIRKSIFSTAAIEGNPLSEAEVGKVLSDEEKQEKLKKFDRQIMNLKRTYAYVRFLWESTEPYVVTEEVIKNIHKTLTEGSDMDKNDPGRYRAHEVKVGDVPHGGVYVPPKILEDIKKLMSEFVRFLNSEEVLKIDPALRAALAHYYFALIHPFGDGNGRTARVLEAILLKTAYIKYVPVMMSNYYYKNIDEYFVVFSSAERNKDHDITAFLEFFTKGLNATLTEIYGFITANIRMFTLRHYFESLRKNGTITQRQYDLLTLLIDGMHKFTLKELFEKDNLKIIYRNVTERTARRDIKRLLDRKLISPLADGLYEINTKILG